MSVSTVSTNAMNIMMSTSTADVAPTDVSAGDHQSQVIAIVGGVVGGLLISTVMVVIAVTAITCYR